MLRTLIRSLHHRLSHKNRTEILAEIISGLIVRAGNRRPFCLDIGCGDMALTRKLKKILPNGTFYGIDLQVQDAPEIKGINYQQFNGCDIPFDNNTFDIVMLIDVLHHASRKQQIQLLHEASRVGKILIIKDHLSTGAWSDAVLYAADVFGNWGKRVISPGLYFNQESYSTILRTSGLTEIHRISTVDLYKNTPLVCYVMKPCWQIISVLKR